jgi:hypothetical protein
MRKLLIPLIILFAVKAAGETSSVRFSIFANPCINWFNSDVKNTKSVSPVFGFDAGLTIDKYFAENYAFTTGLSIGTLGGKLNYSDESVEFSTPDPSVTISSNTDIKYSLQYITLPIGLKFKTKEIGYFTYFAHLGLTSQIRIKAKGTSADHQLDNDNILKDVSLFNMGYHIGAGVQYSIGGNTAIIMGVTFTNGFLDVTNNNDKPRITTSSLAIRLGLLF